MEQAANKIVRFLYDSFVDPVSGSSAFALVKAVKTHKFGELNPSIQQFAQNHSLLIRLFPKAVLIWAELAG
jgi:hypothetical protein